MRNTIILLLLIALMPSTALARREKIPDDLKDAFKAIIQHHNFVCTECNNGYFLGITERGKLFEIYCDHDRFAYRVILQPNKNLIVLPLNE